MTDTRGPGSILTTACVAASLAALVSVGVWAWHSGDDFVGDDFQLIADGLEGVSLLQPVASHLRPAIRLHFQLYRWIQAPVFFGVVSLLLHLVACGAVFVALRACHGTRVALPTTLLFAGSFLANEAVFWSSSAATLYCMLFSALALWCFVRGDLVAAYLLLVPAALSYELWLVVPVLFLFHFRKARELVVPFAMAVAYLAAQLALFGAGGASAYGGFSLLQFPQRFSIYAFRFLSPLSGSPSMPIAMLLTALLLGLFALPRYRFAATLYSASAVLFSLSAHVASRFYYFPALALMLMVGLGLDAPRRSARLVALLVTLYLAAMGPWINYLDGLDYGAKARLHRDVFQTVERGIGSLDPGQDQAVIVNRLGPEVLAALGERLRGRPKLIFVRGPALGGMIYAEDAVRMALWRRGFRPEPADCTGRPIEVGTGPVRSTYCFRIVPR